MILGLSQHRGRKLQIESQSEKAGKTEPEISEVSGV